MTLHNKSTRQITGEHPPTDVLYHTVFKRSRKGRCKSQTVSKSKGRWNDLMYRTIRGVVHNCR